VFLKERKETGFVIFLITGMTAPGFFCERGTTTTATARARILYILLFVTIIKWLYPDVEDIKDKKSGW
jgi:hypothetical protein